MPVPYQQVNGLVLTGNEMQRIAKLCNAEPIDGNYVIKSKTLTNLYQTIRLMPLEKIALKFDLTEEVARMFLFFSGYLCKAFEIYGSRLCFCPKSRFMGYPN